MIRITTNNNALAILPDTKFTFVRENPVFAGNEGDFSLPLELPTEPNAETLGFVHDIHRPGAKALSFPVTVEECGRTIVQGTFAASSVKNNRVRGNIKSGAADFYTAIKDKNIQDLDLGGVTIPIYSDVEAAKTLATQSTTDHLTYVFFPVYDRTNNLVVNRTAQETEAWDWETVSASVRACPFFRLWAVVEHLVGALGFGVASNVLKTDNDLNRVVSLNTVSYIGYIGTQWKYKWACGNCTVADFITAVEWSVGVQFVVDSVSKQVRIVKRDDNFTVQRTDLSFSPDYEIDDVGTATSVKISFSEAFGYADEFENTIDYLYGGILPVVTEVATKSNLPTATTAGRKYLVKSEGVLYIESENAEWEPKGSVALSKTYGTGTPTEQDLKAAVARNYTKTRVIGSGGRTSTETLLMPVFELSLEELAAISVPVFSVYRGKFLNTVTIDETVEDVNGPITTTTTIEVARPYAHYLPYKHDGAAIAGDTLAITPGYPHARNCINYNYLLLDLLANSYALSAKSFCTLNEYLALNIYEAIDYRGQTAFIESMSAPVNGSAEKIVDIKLRVRNPA